MKEPEYFGILGDQTTLPVRMLVIPVAHPLDLTLVHD
jgi:hypothetical protein